MTIIGYSGGGQVAVGAAAYLKEIIHAPVTVVSLGGIMASDEGLLALENLYHLAGRRDRVQRLGPLFFPGRWPILPYSAWNQAKAKGIIHLVDMGPTDHTGRGGYLDAEATLPDGRTYLEATVATIGKIVKSGKESTEYRVPSTE